MKILVINGPNLNMLGKREPHIYGNATLDDLISFIKDTFRENFEIEFFQSNHEGEIIDKLHEASDIFDGVVLVIIVMRFMMQLNLSILIV